MKFEEWLAQQDGVIEVDCGCVTAEAFYHWMRVAYESGNFSVVPDGYVLVPKEPTEAMCDISHIGVDVYCGITDDNEYYSIGGTEAAKVWKAMLAAAPQPPVRERAIVPGEWIPVSERLPENKPGGYEYLVFETLNGCVNHDYWAVPDIGQEFTPFWNRYGNYVTHWMPLPVGPKEQDNV